MKKKVLIIDDDLTVCRQIKYALQSITTDVYYAISVSEGLKRFMEQEYCLVIMDVVLSEADGQELLKIMRRTKTTPILVLSSKPGREAKLSTYQAGAHAYLEKPYECEGLVRMFLRFRFCGIVCCVLYRFSFPQSDL